MELGKIFGLSQEGLDFLSLKGFVLGIDLDDTTTVTVEKEASDCICGSKNKHHTDDCGAMFVMMKISGPAGATAWLSAKHVRPLTGPSLRCSRPICLHHG